MAPAGFTTITGFGALPGQPYDVWAGFFGGQGSFAASMFTLAMIVFFMATLVYMLAVAFNFQNLKTWAKAEYMQLIVTFLLAIFIVAAYNQLWVLMVNSVSTFYHVTNPQTDPNLYYEPFSFAQSYIGTTLIGCEKTVYRAVYAVNFYYRLIGRLSTDVIGADSLGGWSTSLYTGFFEYITGHLNYLLLLNYIQIRFLTLIKYAMPLLVQIGLILRAFPYSRGAGGLLIAIGFGFYCVYPVTLAMLMTLLPSPVSSICTSFSPPVLFDLSDGGTVETPGDIVMVSYTIKSTQKEIGSLRTQIETFLPIFYLQSMFLPLVALTITFTFVRQTGAIFGADLNEIGRGLIKLI